MITIMSVYPATPPTNILFSTNGATKSSQEYAFFYFSIFLRQPHDVIGKKTVGGVARYIKKCYTNDNFNGIRSDARAVSSGIKLLKMYS